MSVTAELTDVTIEGVRRVRQNSTFWLDFASKFGPKSVGACVEHVARSFRTLGRGASPWATPENLQDHLNVAKYGVVPGDVTYFSRDHLLLQRGRMASAALSDF